MAQPRTQRFLFVYKASTVTPIAKLAPSVTGLLLSRRQHLKVIGLLAYSWASLLSMRWRNIALPLSWVPWALPLSWVRPSTAEPLEIFLLDDGLVLLGVDVDGVERIGSGLRIM